MRLLGWILKFALFMAVLTFAIKNTDLVTVRYYFGGEWQAPLIFILMLAFCAGVVAGLLASLSQWVRQRRELGALRRELRSANRDREASGAQAADLARSAG